MIRWVTSHVVTIKLSNISSYATIATITLCAWYAEWRHKLWQLICGIDQVLQLYSHTEPCLPCCTVYLCGLFFPLYPEGWKNNLHFTCWNMFLFLQVVSPSRPSLVSLLSAWWPSSTSSPTSTGNMLQLSGYTVFNSSKYKVFVFLLFSVRVL